MEGCGEGGGASTCLLLLRGAGASRRQDRLTTGLGAVSSKRQVLAPADFEECLPTHERLRSTFPLAVGDTRFTKIGTPYYGRRALSGHSATLDLLRRARRLPGLPRGPASPPPPSAPKICLDLFFFGGACGGVLGVRTKEMTKPIEE